MDELIGRAVFAVGDRTYCWEDVLLAAGLSGEWDAFEGRLRQGLACAKRAEQLGQGPSLETLEEAASDFRYDRDLIAADEMQSWLEARGLDVEEWMGYVLRERLRRDLAADLAEIESRFPVDECELQAALAAEGLCGGEFRRFALALAAHAAAAAAASTPASEVASTPASEAASTPAPEAASTPAPEAGATPAPGPVSTPQPETAFATESLDPDSLPRALRRLSPDQLRERLTALTWVRAGFGRFRSSVLSPEAIRSQVAAHRLDWIRLACRVATFPAEDMAREAALCVHEDGQDLEEVAAGAACDLREGSFFLEELDASLRDALLGATRGELLGPLAMDGEFALVLVTDKVMPSESDPETRVRAEDRIVEACLDREIERRVRWIDLL